ncbi:MOTHER of FT and TF 1 protein [Phytophthora cinnamomi]|uniref:MOTHER of FT and TF 1 protein n=1 Tax=Phytophthora cinnamomi TaxID=4785 RepID=UPI00355AA9C6|nr:MOTHER of FT and TF 1 protein [Phytophthora cinnamomi]
MSTPLKALIQERLRAKMVCRRPGYDLDDDYEGDSGRLARQPVDVTAYDVSVRGADDEDALMNTGARGSTSRRSSSTQPTYPIRLHTHIDPSAYLVDDRYYASSASYGASGNSHGDHNRQRYSRYPREQYRDTNVYDLPPRPEQQQQQHSRDHRRRQHTHHRVREQQQQPRYDSPPRGGYMSRQPSQTRAAVSPWRRSEYTSVPTTKGRSMTRSPIRAVPSPRHSPTLRGHRKQDFDYPDHFDDDFTTRHCRETKSTFPSPRFAPSSNTSDHQIHRQDYFLNQRYTWKNRQDYSNQSTYEMRAPSPTRHPGHNDHPPFEKPARHSLAYRGHSNQIESDNAKSYPVAPTTSTRKLLPEEIISIDDSSIGHESERHSPPQLDMEIIDPPTRATGRTRTWEDIMSPESRLAARAFVEKRQRRTEKSTPRTMATQRWLEVIDARANKQT